VSVTTALRTSSFLARLLTTITFVCSDVAATQTPLLRLHTNSPPPPTRSIPCIFLMYPSDIKGYRCYDPERQRVLTSQHMYFDETCFPFRSVTTAPTTAPPTTCPSAVDTIVVPGPTPPTRVAAIRHRALAANVSGAPHDVANAPSASPLSAGQQGALLADIDALPACPSPRTTTDAPSSATVSTAPASVVPPAGHHMLTWFKIGHLQPNRKYACSADVQQPPATPSSMRATLCDPTWHAAMQEEFSALQANNTWRLVPRPPIVNVITGKWLFKNKLILDESLDRRKARWVIRGFKQRPSIDFD
jgi:hypothetical protein